MGASRYLVAPYYLIPVMPVVFLLLADILNELREKMQFNNHFYNQWVGLIFVMLFIVSLIQPVINTIRHEVSLSKPNTRYLAKIWIENNIPFGSKILMDSGKSINSFSPLIAENEKSLQRMLNNFKRNIENGKIVHGMVDENALIYYKLLLKTVPKESYDITSTMFGLKVSPLDYYIKNKFQYIIISENMRSNRTSNLFSEQNPSIARFYNSLNTDKRIKLIKTIWPSAKNSGDAFYIYQLKLS
jgi:hypothetical protein